MKNTGSFRILCPSLIWDVTHLDKYLSLFTSLLFGTQLWGYGWTETLDYMLRNCVNILFKKKNHFRRLSDAYSCRLSDAYQWFPSLKRRFQLSLIRHLPMLSVAYPTPLSVAYPTFTKDICRLSDGNAVALPTAWRLFSQKNITTVEHLLSLNRRLTFNRRLLRYRLTDGYIGVG